MAVNPNIKKKADDIRTRKKGVEVRESLASGLEAMSSDVVDTVDRQSNVESQFQDVIENTTDKDVISAPEIIAARNGESNLKARLDKEKNEVAAQLEQIAVNVKTYGAIGDGETDDTVAIQNAFNSLNDGDSILFPGGDYKVSEVLTITKAVKLEMNGQLIIDHDGTGLIFKDDSSYGSFHPNYHNRHKLDLKLKIKRVQKNEYMFSENAIGVEFWNVFSARIYLDELENHYIGALYKGDKYGTGYAGTSYTSTTIGVIRSHMRNIDMVAENTGYVTQNQFYSGSLTFEGNDTSQISVNMDNKGTSSFNENTFFGVSFEGGATAIKGRNGSSNHFKACRFEMPNVVNVFDFDDNFRFNTITECGYMGSHMKVDKFIDNSSQNYVSFIDFQLGRIEYFDGVFYITPNKTETARGGNNNSFNLLHLPDSWDTRIVTDGLSSYVFYSDRFTENNTMTIPINRFTEQIIYERPDLGGAFDSLILSTPPVRSFEFFVYFVTSSQGKTIGVDSSISTFVDSTGNEGVIPSNVSNIHLLYSSRSNGLTVLGYY